MLSQIQPWLSLAFLSIKRGLRMYTMCLASSGIWLDIQVPLNILLIWHELQMAGLSLSWFCPICNIKTILPFTSIFSSLFVDGCFKFNFYEETMVWFGFDGKEAIPIVFQVKMNRWEFHVFFVLVSLFQQDASSCHSTLPKQSLDSPSYCMNFYFFFRPCTWFKFTWFSLCRLYTLQCDIAVISLHCFCHGKWEKFLKE